MASTMSTANTQRPLRILTIDNGGLQAISILDILKEVCHELSSAEGYSYAKKPHELFDIIAGVGTGGWLAILLGRYKLDIQQCLTVYMSIANSISPSNTPPKCKQRTKTSAAISQKILQREIEGFIASKGLNEYLVDEEEADAVASDRKCRAFAVGPVKRTSEERKHQHYQLFRTYKTPIDAAGEQIPGPNPATCKVSMACLATAAAKDFLDECQIDGTTYWDTDFPKTHNITSMALKEANVLFGSKPALECIVNISPGLPSSAEIDSLLVAGKKSKKHSTSRPKSFGEVLRRIRSACDATDLTRTSLTALPRRNSDPAPEPKRSATSSSTSSVSSEASETERGHQKQIRDYLEQVHGSSEMYVRLEMTAASGEKKPYLDDIYQTKLSARLVQKFLELPETKERIDHIGDMCRGVRRDQTPPSSSPTGLRCAGMKAPLPPLKTAMPQQVS